MDSKLDENQIYIVQLALERAKELLKLTYQESYLSTQLQLINEKLNQQLKEQEHYR